MGLPVEDFDELYSKVDSSTGFWSQCYENYCSISETFVISNILEQNYSGTIATLLQIQVVNIVLSLFKDVHFIHRGPQHFHYITLHLTSIFCRLVAIAPFHFRDKDQHAILLSTTSKTFVASMDPEFRALTKAYCRPSQLRWI